MGKSFSIQGYVQKSMKILSGPVIAAMVIIGIFAGLTVYSGIFPPVTVVESGSMQHSVNWEYGTINTGDIVVVKKVSDPVKQVTTYLQGRTSGYSTYGDYGNVLLYHDPNGLVVIHRAMFYLTWSNGAPVVQGYTNQSWITVTHTYVLIKDVGFSHRNLLVLLNGFQNESGYITMGDHNLAIATLYNKNLQAYVAADENVNIMNHPVTSSEVIGVAQGQIPWFGLIKLNLMRIQGDWSYYNDVPHYSYDYLFISLAIMAIAIFFPYDRVLSSGSKKNNKK